MIYDVAPNEMPDRKTWTLELYQRIVDRIDARLSHLIVIGFEPGQQAAGGQWEGKAVDQQVIEMVKAKGLGGIMFWAVN